MNPNRRHPSRLLSGLAAVLISGLMFADAQSQKPDPIATAESDVNALVTQLKMYFAWNGIYPSTDQGIKAMVERPTNEPIPPKWHQLLSQIPLDPWGHPYIYKHHGDHNPHSFDIYSAGPDGKPGTDDDIGNW